MPPEATVRAATSVASSSSSGSSEPPPASRAWMCAAASRVSSLENSASMSISARAARPAAGDARH